MIQDEQINLELPLDAGLDTPSQDNGHVGDYNEAGQPNTASFFIATMWVHPGPEELQVGKV